MQLNRLTGTNRISDEYSLLNDNADILEQYAADTDAAIQAAQQAADAAQDTADQAVQDASQAQQTADTAVTAAAAAQLTANSAVSAAATAQQTAEDAQDAADAAQQTADDAGSGLATHMADDVRHLTTADRTKFASIQPGAQVNQNAIAQINDIEADSPTDALTIAGGTGISISTNQITKTVNITATGTSTPGPHASSHLEDGSDPIPLASVTNGGLMSAQDKQDLESAKQAIEQGQSIPAPIQRGVNVIQSDQPSGATFNVLGRTLVNILGRDGGCESLAPFTSNGGIPSPSLSTDRKRNGSSSIKIERTDSAGGNYLFKDYSFVLDPTKYYLLAGWVFIESYVSGAITLGLRDIGTTTGRYAASVNASTIGEWQLVFAKIPTANTLVGNGFRLMFGLTGTNNNAALYFDDIRLYEVSAADYAAIGTTITGAEIDARWPYVDSVQPLRGVSVMMPGKNLLPPFTQWTLHSAFTIDEPYKMTYVRTASGQNAEMRIPAVAQQQYTLSLPAARRVNVIYLNAAGSQIDALGYAVRSQATFTTPAGTDRIAVQFNEVSNGTYTYEYPMLVLGDASNLPASFEPYAPRYAHAPLDLYSNVDRSIADSYDSATGQVFRRWRGGVKLDGSSTLSTTQARDGFYEISAQLAIAAVNTNGTNPKTQQVVKYNGSIMSHMSSGSVDGRVDATAIASNVLYVCVGLAQSGWLAGVTPSQSAVRALLNGWRATANNGTTYTSWESILDGSAPPTNTEAYVAANKAPGWDAYATLDYVRATPVVEQLTGDLGGLDVESGANTVELIEGVIVRERVTPVQFGGSGQYYINRISAVGSTLSHRSDKILAIYKGTEIEPFTSDINTGWVYGMSDAYGNERYTASASYVDPDAEYFVDYIVLDKYAYTANVIDAKLTYQSTLGGAVAQSVQDIAALKRHEGVQDWAIDWTEAKADNIRFDLDTLDGDFDDHVGSGGAAHAAATTAVAGFMTGPQVTKLDGIEAGAQVNRPIATQAQAEAGTDNTTDMTPLRTKQYVDQRLRNNIIWRINNGAPEWSNDGGGTWSPVASVKSIQRGSVSFGAAGGAVTVNVTISAVDMAKSILLVSTRGSYSTAHDGLMTANATIKFLSNTEIQLQVSPASSGSAYSEWQVLEYN